MIAEILFEFLVKESKEMAKGYVDAARNSKGRLFQGRCCNSRKTYWWFEDEKDEKIRLREWQEKMSEFYEYGQTEKWVDMPGDLMFDILYISDIELFHLFWAIEKISVWAIYYGT